MDIGNGEQRIKEIAEDIIGGKERSNTVREVLGWFGYARRRASIVSVIRQSLEENNLATRPDFESGYIDGSVEFVMRESADSVNPSTELPLTDPTFRIRKLEAANKAVVSVSPDSDWHQATTLMLLHNFSQLPVMTGKRDVKGIVSWASIGKRLALGQEPTWVRECMDQHQEIGIDSSLFDAITTIVESEYVLVRNEQSEISGIVTTADLSLQFQQLGEPFLLIGEIENYVRRMIKGRFSVDALAQAGDPSNPGKTIERVEDLTLGEYCRLLENQSRWQSLGLSIDRKEFIKKLDEVRDIRNDIMHFEPDGISDEALEVLRQLVKFFQSMAKVGAI